MEALFTQEEFTAYGLSHAIVVLIFLLGGAAVVLIGRGHPDAAAARRTSRIFAVVILVLFIASQIYLSIPPSLSRSVPLHISSLLPLVSAYALWTHRHWAFALTYFWGLVLSTQALISPVLAFEFPHIAFLAFWALHLLVVWAAIYLTWGLGMRPDWRSYRITVLVTFAWAAVTMTFNPLADTNYGYLNDKPGVATVLDLLGPWPVYLLPVAALVLGAWALITWPWVRARRARAAQRVTAQQV